MKTIFQLFLLDLRIKFKRAVAFRANFVLVFFLSLGYTFAFSLFQFLIYTGVNGFPGWNMDQVLLFQAMLIFWTGVTEFLFGGVKYIIDLEVMYGNFDRYLVLPHHPLVSLFTRGTDIYAISSVMAGLGGMVIMCARMHLVPDAGTILLAMIFFISGILFYLSLLIWYCSCTLLLIKMDRLKEVLEKILFFGSFPADVYYGIGKLFFLVVFPTALWVYIPVQILLGRFNELSYLSLVISIFFFAASVLFWKYQAGKYSSAGG